LVLAKGLADFINAFGEKLAYTHSLTNDPERRRP